ncbi:Ldh family oxidoreductase [Paenibacillus sp. P26]|nr:Ldh family oxidoreductase [Paenibacillus sp. P26]UUZ93725.1 Ldh family oxidoreductase [Paenibacillus sp. P25]
MTYTSIAISELKKLAVQILVQKGASEQEAEIVAEDYLDADLRGRSSHGFASFSTAVEAFENRGKYQVERFEGSVLSIHGNGDSGHLVARDAIDLSLQRLQSQKVLAVGISDITRFNCPGAIARYGAERGAVTLVWEYGGKNLMVPHGGKQAAVSTSPFGIGIPHTDPLFVVDIALSERAIGFVELAKLKGEPIPETWGVDREGRPTADPHQVAAVNPFGGYKGFALALAFEILSGALVGVPIGSKGSLGRRGALILLIDPTLFGQSTEAFRDQVVAFLQEVTGTPAVDPSVPVTYPGQGSEARVRAQLEQGVLTLPEPVITQIRNWAEAAVQAR